MAIDVSVRRTRRGILAGALGAAAAAGFETIARPATVEAVVTSVGLGVPNPATSLTSITNTASDGSAFKGIANGAGVGLFGNSPSGSAVYGSSDLGTGIEGYSLRGVAASGFSGSSIGVSGASNSSTLPAVLGLSAGFNTGLQGYSGPDSQPPSPAKTGVFGYAAQDGDARGVTGQSTSGRGLNGIATSGTGVYGRASSGEGVRGTSTGSNGVAGSSGSDVASGVYGENSAGGAGTYGRCNALAGTGAFGESTSGTGVHGSSTSGTGVRGASSSGDGIRGYSQLAAGVMAQTGTGYALETLGRLNIDTSGVITIPAGSTSKMVTPGVDVTAGSFVLLTPSVNLAGRDLWFTKDMALDTITIHLSSSRTSSTKVSWLLLG